MSTAVDRPSDEADCPGGVVMMRSWVGAGIVTLVLTGVVTGPALFGPDATGTAVRQPPPTPPPVGTCLNEPAYLSAAGVPCGQPHDGEIVLAWTGRVPADSHLELPEGADPDEPGIWCVAAGDDYVGTTVLLEGITWSMPWAQLMYSVIRGPDRDYHPGWSWTACALTIAMTGDTSTGPTTGSLRSVLTDPSGPRPSGWVRCGAAPGFTRSVPCTGPHRSEQIAIATLPLDGETADGADTPVTDPRVEEQCRTLVDRYLGAPSGTHADDLVAVVTSLGPSVERRDGENHAVGAVFDCSVQITGDRDLIGTVNALGTAPLPLG